MTVMICEVSLFSFKELIDRVTEFILVAALGE